MARDYTSYQKKVIQRYYENQGQILHQRLSDLVGELYLASEKQRAKLWTRAAEVMEKLGVPASRIEHLVERRDPTLLAEVVKEIESR